MFLPDGPPLISSVISHPNVLFSAKGSLPRAQCVGAIPIVATERGPRFVLVTARGRSGRWIFPKGKAEEFLSGATAASKEAFEEAGILGRIFPRVIATDHAIKKGEELVTHFYVMEVVQMANRWPEMHERERWLATAHEASEAVEEVTLKELVLRLNHAMSGYRPVVETVTAN